jgi:hypothetical protein
MPAEGDKKDAAVAASFLSPSYYYPKVRKTRERGWFF